MKSFLFFLYISATLLLAGCADVEPQSPARITFYVGDVTVNQEAASVGMTIHSGDTIVTAPRSSCDIAIGDSILRIKEASTLDITKAVLENGNDKSDITLESGGLLCKPKKLLKEEEFIVRTQTSVAAVRGTEFSVRTDAKDTTQIKVYEGSVKVAPRVAQLDETPEKLTEYGSSITANQSAVISREDAAKAEAAISKSLAEGSGVDDALRTNREVIELGENRIQEFSPSDFSREMEIIDVEAEEEPEPAPVVVRRRRVVPEKLVVSRYEVYKVRDGQITQKAAIKGRPVTYNNRVYAASADRVYAADENGKILWERPAAAIQTISREGNVLKVTTSSGTQNLSLLDGSVQ